MSIEKFRAFVVRQADGEFKRQIEERRPEDLKGGDLLVKVRYSALNYKDALSATGHKGVTRRYPHVPGVEAVGVVVESGSDKICVGDNVYLAGRGFGTMRDGGFAEYVRFSSDAAIRLDGLGLTDSIVLGVAGFTAALSLYKLEQAGLNPESGPVLVTGATGGVGSLAVAILSRAGYYCVAATGKKEKTEYLKMLGASEVIDRREIDDPEGAALLKEHWGGVIDSVGGNILATAVKSLRYGCSATTCGLTQSDQLETTVYPFILRGVNLLGVDAVQCPAELRVKLWNKLSQDWKPDSLKEIAHLCSLEELDEKIDLILHGGTWGRVIIDMEK